MQSTSSSKIRKNQSVTEEPRCGIEVKTRKFVLDFQKIAVGNAFICLICRDMTNNMAAGLRTEFKVNKSL
jgi:hypothetical protein